MDTSNIISLIVSILYIALIGLLSIFSMLSIYIFIRYGRSRSLTTAVSVTYIVLFIALLGYGYSIISTLIL